MQFILSLILSFLALASLNGETKEPEIDYCKYADEVTSLFLNEVHKEYGFECGATGGSMPRDVEGIYVQLTAYRSATIEEARELEVILIEKFAQIINAHEKIRPFLREYPFPPSRVKISIFFEKLKRKKSAKTADDQVRLVLQARNKIFYHGDNPNNQYMYTDLKDEPYEEARAIVYKNNPKNDLKSKEAF